MPLKIFWEVEQQVTLPNVLAIGECGLDNVCDTPWEDQRNAFIPQVVLANKLRKPLIIHCVRAYDELEALLLQQRNNVPVIIHGFNRKQTIAGKLLESGYYLSFGRALMNEGAPAQAVFRNIPLDRFFLETDNSDISIKDIYIKAAEIKETSVDGIILQVQQNFKKVFA
jgi:TatD DNase family protein